MAGLNKAILIGNLGRDPEVRAIDSGRKVANFSLATTESYRDKNGERVDQTEWHNIVLWGALAEIAEKYLRKGNQVYVEGRIRTRSYEDKEGVTKYITEVVGSNMTMLGGRPSDSNSGSSTGASSGKPSYENETSSGTSDLSVDDDTDDLPF